MDHILESKALLKEAADYAKAPVSRFGVKPVARRTDRQPSAAWSCLTEVTLDPDTLRANHLIARKPGTETLPVDMLRTRLVSQMRRDGHRRLAITSPLSGCGKSTLTGNLALSLARRADLKTIVFDFDLRRPTLIKTFGLDNSGPRQSALTGTLRNFDSTCLRIGHNLALSLSANPTETPAELLGSDRTRILLDRIEQAFEPDLMLFDLPPILPLDDARAALDVVDGALLVAMADHTTLEDIEQSRLLIEAQTECIGTVLNKCRFARRRSSLFKAPIRDGTGNHTAHSQSAHTIAFDKISEPSRIT